MQNENLIYVKRRQVGDNTTVCNKKHTTKAATNVTLTSRHNPRRKIWKFMFWFFYGLSTCTNGSSEWAKRQPQLWPSFLRHAMQCWSVELFPIVCDTASAPPSRVKKSVDCCPVLTHIELLRMSQP